MGNDQVAGREDSDPINLIYRVEMEDSKVLDFSIEELDKQSIYQSPIIKGKEAEDVPESRPVEKIHPEIQQWLETRPNEFEEIVLVLDDDFIIPRFPEPAIYEPRSSELNQKLLARANKLVEEIKAERRLNYRKILSEFEESYQIKFSETFWLINGAVAEVRISEIPKLLEHPSVMYVEPKISNVIPPQDLNTQNDVEDARDLLNTDPYFKLGLSLGWIGLLDTGMRFSHDQFNNPDTIAFERDCVNGGSDCNTGSTLNPNDDCWNHGTSSAGILTGNSNLGQEFRGVTSITLDSFKVYPTSFDANGLCNGGLDTAASVRGFQEAVRVLDRVIVAEMQGLGGYLSSIAVAADNAFDAGAVIIAANGNWDPPATLPVPDGTVSVPALAHKVLGVGNFDVQSQVQIASQRRGPTIDNRIKPDIQAPTNTETASNTSDTALRVFSGTSGATPYAAGAAALRRNWMRDISFTTDPGQVYAHMILSGQDTFVFNNTTGAGPIELPINGISFWGKVSIQPGQTIEIPLTIKSDVANDLDGALWWPEWVQEFWGLTLDPHNDIDLYLIDPNGNFMSSSLSIPSVFERARAKGSVEPGTWILQIRAYSMDTLSQDVYWAATVRTR